MTWSTLIAGRDRDVIFDLVRACVWADGRLSADELAAARGTAIALDVLRSPGVPGSLARRGDATPDLAGLSLIGRHVAFTTAAWITWIDGPPSHEESKLLARLAARLGLQDQDVEAIAREVARSSDDIRRCETTMSAPDWAIEIDGLLSWAAAFALDVVPRNPRALSRPAG